jgi:hypothetical protein
MSKNNKKDSSKEQGDSFEKATGECKDLRQQREKKELSAYLR